MSVDAGSAERLDARGLGGSLFIWLIAAVLFAAWFVGKFIAGKEGFIHILLLCAIAVAFVQFIHERRARGR